MADAPHVQIIREKPLEEVNENLRNALSLALSVIDGYEMDIRNARIKGEIVLGFDASDDDGPSLKDVGFCQGSIYLKASEMIQRLATGKASL